jgi:hypothetical protein
MLLWYGWFDAELAQGAKYIQALMQLHLLSGSATDATNL